MPVCAPEMFCARVATVEKVRYLESMSGVPHLTINVGSAAGGFRVLPSPDGNVRIAAWGYWPPEVISAFGVSAAAAAQALVAGSVFVFDSKDLKPQGAEGQEALRALFRALAPQPFAKGVILRGNAMTCMQLARLLRECAVDKRLEFADAEALGG